MPSHPTTTAVLPDQVIDATRHWLEVAVIGLNLCPFAKAVHQHRQIHYQVSDTVTESSLLADLTAALRALVEADPLSIETTLLIHPYVLLDFLDYNDFLADADRLLIDLELDGVVQIASFHPDYQFAGTQADAIDNFTNRSPYPLLHLLRESSIDRAVTAFPNADAIVSRNIATMQRLGVDGWHALQVGNVTKS
jgi:hypothetical protein